MKKVLIVTAILVGLFGSYFGYLKYKTRELFQPKDKVLIAVSDLTPKTEFACPVSTTAAFAVVSQSRVFPTEAGGLFGYERFYQVLVPVLVNNEVVIGEAVVPANALTKATELDEVICTAMLNIPFKQ